MSLSDIKSGWFNYIKSLMSSFSLDPAFKKVVKSRSEICSDCPELRITNFTKSSIRGMCNQCRCAYPALIFAPKKKCPIGKWDKHEP